MAKTTLRRGYKRPGRRTLEVIPQRPPTAELPRPVEEALRTGEVYCPMKWGLIATEACATTQNNRGSCASYRCGFLGHGERFAAEADKARASKPSGLKPRGGAEDDGDGGEGEDDEQ